MNVCRPTYVLTYFKDLDLQIIPSSHSCHLPHDTITLRRLTILASVPLLRLKLICAVYKDSFRTSKRTVFSVLPVERPVSERCMGM